MDSIFTIKKNSLIAYYQGLFNDNAQKVGCELLIRHNHPTNGIVSPGQFLPDYEGTKLITSIDLWSFHEALKWQLNHPHLNVSSNISGTSLMSLDFLNEVETLADKLNVDRSKFTLEITEEDDIPPLGIEHCERLKNLGFKIALDDWGTKNSGANRLFSLPIDTVKIDRLLIQSISEGCCILRQCMSTPLSHCPISVMENPNHCKATILIKSTISAAHQMHMLVVAEGIETKEQFDILSALNCDLFQGYYLERPRPQ